MKKIVLIVGTITLAKASFAQYYAEMPSKTALPKARPAISNILYFADGDAKPVSTTTEYKVWALTTNFSVPIVRFNFVNKVPGDSVKGNISFFNSIGAGIFLSRGRLDETTDANGNVINEDLNNIIGVQVGFLFSANVNGSTTTNIFAPTIGVSILNFQIGYGYEFGTVSQNTKRGFLTVAYAIPVSKLIQGGFYIINRSNTAVNKAKKKEGFF
jgi:hypothetical protein